jgi:hypothetical protein
MGQKFIARERYEFSNGAIGYRPGGPFDCLGPYAKVQNCPIEGTALRRTCYATGYADTFFSIPASTRHKGQHIGGFFTSDGDAVRFVPTNPHKAKLGLRRWTVRYLWRATGAYAHSSELWATDEARAIIAVCAANPGCLILSAIETHQD